MSYICIEGIDSTGKTTAIKKLKKYFTKAIFTREPYDVRFRNMLKSGTLKSKEAQMFAFLADRAEHYKRVIEPNSGNIIISDRGIISGIAYSPNWIEISNVISMNLLASVLPDFVFILEIEPYELEKRLSAKKKDDLENISIEEFMAIQERIRKVVDMLKIKHIIVKDNSYCLSRIADLIKGTSCITK
jgi:dTMP kinase